MSKKIVWGIELRYGEALKVYCWDTTAKKLIVEPHTNNQVMTPIVVQAKNHDRRCETVAICNTCKTKLLKSKLVTSR